MLLFALIADFDVMVQSLVDAIAFMLAIHIDEKVTPQYAYDHLSMLMPVQGNIDPAAVLINMIKINMITIATTIQVIFKYYINPSPRSLKVFSWTQYN
mgnify:CR=1 FL=1